jgi:hypothetical protein
MQPMMRPSILSAWMNTMFARLEAVIRSPFFSGKYPLWTVYRFLAGALPLFGEPIRLSAWYVLTH